MTLWKLRRRARKSGRVFDRLVRESGKSVEDCSGEEWYADYCIEAICIDADERKAISDELLYDAQKLYLPTPALHDEHKWDSDHAITSPTKFLTPEAMTELRSAIRKEQTERRAVVEWWLKVVGGSVGILTGLVGALIGLIAILKK
jgi:hypothetical protein